MSHVVLPLALASAAIAIVSSPPASAQQSNPASASPDPTLQPRPVPEPPNPLMQAGKISLDVLVSSAGKPLTGLQPADFQILDNNEPAKILSFRSFDGNLVKPEPPVEVILLLDELNPAPDRIAYDRDALMTFLRQNGGHLAHPSSLMVLTDAGLRIQPHPSLDGLALASTVKSLPAHISTINSGMGAEGALERFQRSVSALAEIAENYAKSPNRRLLIWIGSGWPMIESVKFSSSSRDQERFFDTIVELTNRLREARIVVYSVSPTDPTTLAERYKPYLKGVENAHQAEPGDLALKVLATQTGGRVLGPDNAVVPQINACISDADAFYQLSFDPPSTGDHTEYHALKVVVKQPGAETRTRSGYYSAAHGN